MDARLCRDTRHRPEIVNRAHPNNHPGRRFHSVDHDSSSNGSAGCPDRAEGSTEAARVEIQRVLEGPLGTDEIRRLLPAGGPAKDLIEEVLRTVPVAAPMGVDAEVRA